jgi:hypothetical protein
MYEAREIWGGGQVWNGKEALKRFETFSRYVIKNSWKLHYVCGILMWWDLSNCAYEIIHFKTPESIQVTSITPLKQNKMPISSLYKSFSCYKIVISRHSSMKSLGRGFQIVMTLQ